MMFRFSKAADQRVLAAYQRLPAWQQYVLGPLLMSAYVATMWPTPILIGLIAAFFAYIKIAYVPEAAFDPEWLPWSQLGWKLTGPLWYPLAIGYPMLIWYSIGLIPYALIVHRRQRRAGQPFVLHDPALVLGKDTSTRLQQGKLLTDEDLRAVALRSRLKTAQIALCGKILGASLLIAFAVNLAIWLFLSHRIDVGLSVFVSVFLCFATVCAPTAWNDDDINLWCGNCRRQIFDAALPALIESRVCPHCSGPMKVVGRRPRGPSGSLWDAEIP